MERKQRSTDQYLTQAEKRVLGALVLLFGAGSLSLGLKSMRSPSLEASHPPAVSAVAPAPKTSKVAINKADLEELESLPGIGPALAQRILEDRRLNGPFHAWEDLKRIRGIGEKTAKKLGPLIDFGQGAPGS